MARLVQGLGAVLNRWSVRWVPDPFVLALGLTVIVALAAGIRLAIAEPGPDSVAWTLIDGWTAGFASTGGLAFALQMCLVLVTGHAIALSPPVQGGIRAIAERPQSSASATALVAGVACAAALIHWGLGVIAGAFLAREIARHARHRGLALHYPLMGAAAYAGMAVWHGGLSGSAPLKVAEALPTGGTLALADTLLSPVNLIVTGAMVVAIPIVCALMTPRDRKDYVAADPERMSEIPERSAAPTEHLVDRVQASRLVGQIVGVFGLCVVGAAMVAGRLDPDINSVNMVFLFIGIALQGSVRDYVAAIADGARGAGAIILQFPFYFGIIGLMKAGGLIGALSGAMVDAANQTTFPVLAYYSGALVNLAIPSGGGQWAVQGELLLGAGSSLGVDPALTVMAFSFGDASTNMLQPFWALPLLGIMGLRARDIIGYTAVLALLVFAIATVGLLAVAALLG